MHQGSIWFVWAHGICKEQRLWVPFATLQEATDDDVDKDDVDDDDDLDDAVDVIVALVVVIVFFVVILLQEKCWRGRAKKKKEHGASCKANHPKELRASWQQKNT